MNRLFVLSVIVSSALAPSGFAKRIDVRTLDYSITSSQREKPTRPPSEEDGCFLEEPAAKALARVQASLRLRQRSLRVLRCSQKPLDRKVKIKCALNAHAEGTSVDVQIRDVAGEPTLYKQYDPCCCEGKKAAAKTKVNVSAEARALGRPDPAEETKTLEKAMSDEGFERTDGCGWHFEFASEKKTKTTAK